MESRWFPGIRQLPSALLLAVALSIPSPVYADGHDKTAADYFVHSLPGAPDGPLVKMHAGHVEITPEHNGNLFFWHFANAHIAERQRTVIWLNGGPGCSSEDGALMEIGPYRLKDGQTLEYNNGSWHEFANLLFVDNPVGTGFSYVNTDSYLHELDEMANQFITFLEKWYAMFPEYEHDDIYIAGESYAGQHIPYIAKAILERNKKPRTPHGPWNLKGLLIGNGWVSPPEQYDSYIKFAYEKGLIEKGSQTAADLEAQYRICTKELAVSPDKVDVQSCERILTDLLDKTAVKNPKTNKNECYNMYDVRLRDTHPSCGMNWPPDLENVTPYLRLKEVIAALHVSGKTTGWTECSGGVGQAFRARNSVPSIKLLPDLLKEMPILLFSGAEDLICNHIGTESFISNMEWSGGKGFEVSPGNWAPRRDWTFEGENAGFWQEARNLTYVLFNNASHMVPFDWPRRSRDMLDRFMGVDAARLGRLPTESTLDGESGPTTSINSTAQAAVDEGEAKDEIEEAKWEAYRRSGEIVLVIVAVAAVAWGIFVWRGRKKRAGPSYQALSTGDADGGRREANGSGTLDNFQHKRNGKARDLEAGDFDESELDDLHAESAGPNATRYSIGGDSDAEEDLNEKKPVNPKGSRSLT